MQQYDVTGMTCAACSARVEKAVSKVPGVTSCSVNLLTNSMGVEGTASSSDIIAAVTNAGYGASVKGEKPEKSAKSSENAQENAFDEAPADSFAGVPGITDVLLNGAHDVGIPAAALP